MKIRIVSFTAKGAALGAALARGLETQGEEAAAFVRSAHCGETAGVRVLEGALSDWTEAAFREADAVIFIGAAGIAVRCIAPYVRDKYLDPAVVVIDETARFAVSLLSGHVGGANDLAVRAAAIVGALPVVTTATDREGRFAVDLFATDNHLSVHPQKRCKDVSAAIVAGERVGFCSDFPFTGTFPWELEETDPGAAAADRPAVGVCVTDRIREAPFSETLFLIPQSVWLGVGCKKGTAEAAVRAAVTAFLAENGIAAAAVAGLASCDIKTDEAGLRKFAREWNRPLAFFSARELAAAQGTFSSSEFVRKTVGVDNVCERAAVLASQGTILAGKYIREGVTVAAARMAVTLRFS